MLSIIIPTYNRSSSLKRTIQSFINQDNIEDYEILISDNNSSDDTKEIVTRLIEDNPKKIIRYHFEKRQGVHYARNSAAKLSNGEVLYFTDDDMEADPNLLAEILNMFTKEIKLGTVTGITIPIFEDSPPDWIKKNMLNHYLAVTDKKDLHWQYFISEEEPVGFYSNHQAIRREAFFNSGGFNPENTKGVWLGDGETGLNIKLRKNKWMFGFTKKSKTYHHIPKSRLTIRYLLKRMANQGNAESFTEFRKYRNTTKYFIYVFLRNLFAFPKIIIHFLRAVIGNRSFIMLLGRIYYYYARNNYDFKIFFNKSFRDTIKKDNWIDS